MSQAVVGKKYGIEQTEVSAIQRMQRVKIARLVDDNDKKVQCPHFCACLLFELSVYSPIVQSVLISSIFFEQYGFRSSTSAAEKF